MPPTSRIARDLSRNVVCIDLAKAMYFSHAAYFGIVAKDFDGLAPAKRQIWVERAREQILVVGAPRITA